jgi:hypothetical protein
MVLVLPREKRSEDGDAEYRSHTPAANGRPWRICETGALPGAAMTIDAEPG